MSLKFTTWKLWLLDGWLQPKPAPSASPSLSSPRHGGVARHQFVPDVLMRGTNSTTEQTAPRQPDLVTVYSPGETQVQRNYGTENPAQHTSGGGDARYQGYENAANTEEA